MSLTACVAANLRALRRHRGLTQGAVASAAGLSVSFISAIENGSRSPPLEVVEALAQALGVDPLALFADPPGQPTGLPGEAADPPAP